MQIKFTPPKKNTVKEQYLSDYELEELEFEQFLKTPIGNKKIAPKDQHVVVFQEEIDEMVGTTGNPDAKPGEIIEEDLPFMKIKTLKEYYKSLGGTKDVTYVNSKKSLIKLIKEING